MAWSLDGLHHKGIPLGERVDSDTLADRGWLVANGDTATPVATLDVDALEHNAEAMAAYCERVGASLAPHAKTTLSPELWAVQRRHGAWAMTAALPRQVALLWREGHDRVLLANELADPSALDRLIRRRDQVDGRRLWVYVDSLEGVALLDAVMAGVGSAPPLDVLVELGHRDGRTGCRRADTAVEVARAAAAATGLRLAGVAAYEGTLGATRDAQTSGRVDGFLADVGSLVETLGAQRLYEVSEPIVTAGGSVWFDRVVTVLGPAARAVGGRLVLRSGCYLVHDHGMYAEGAPSGDRVAGGPDLRPALTVWGRVLSRPEPGLALVDAGRRDVSHDAGLPVPLSAHRPAQCGWSQRPAVDLAGGTVTALSDQHAFVRLPDVGDGGDVGEGPADVRVGDLVRLGISHPCTTFDRWPALLLVDADTRVVGAVRTLF